MSHNNQYMSSTTRPYTHLHLKIIRILTKNEVVDLDTIAVLTNNNRVHIKKILEKFERSGHVARLDNGYCATK